MFLESAVTSGRKHTSLKLLFCRKNGKNMRSQERLCAKEWMVWASEQDYKIGRKKAVEYSRGRRDGCLKGWIVQE